MHHKFRIQNSPPQRLAGPPRILAEKFTSCRAPSTNRHSVRGKTNSKFQILNFQITRFCWLFIAWSLLLGYWNPTLFAEDKKFEPIIVNADKVEYSGDSKEVSATGNVEIIYKGTKLTAENLTINTETKEAIASGNARLDDQRGIIEGSKIVYNFETKKGTIIDAGFRSNPYFGKAKKVEKVSDKEFIARDGYATTCSLDKPHFRIGSKQINMFPNDKIQTKQDTIYLGQVPIFYLPVANRSLKDMNLHVQVSPGSSKEWGPYVLTDYRYNLTQNVDGRIYLDYRNKLGLAEGFGFNYNPPNLGRGDFKFYYTNEKPGDVLEEQPREYERYLMRWRHKWDIGQQTNVISEFYKIVDKRRKLTDPQRSFLKDYFYREYEKDSQPLSYILFHHSFSYSSVDLLMQKRTNNWFDQLDKVPEIKYTMPNLQLGESPFYFESNSSLANFNKKATTSPVTSDDQKVMRLDTLNKVSLPLKVFFIEFTPSISSRQTLYDKGANGKISPFRTIFYSGADLSTKFYRLFNLKSNFLGLDLNGLRHIITPTISYTYNHTPTIPASNLRQIDSIDAISSNNSATLALSNKLQTKRKGQSVDLVDFRVETSYIFKPKTGAKRGSNFSDFLFKLKLLPYSWLRIEGDATYTHSGSRSDPNYNHFSDANYDLIFDFGQERSFGVGQRYERKGGNEITGSFTWRLNPKWKFYVYQRYNMGHDPTLIRGLQEQEYTISRDLHCWNMDITFNSKKNEGSTIWMVFRLKAFPELEFGFNQSYNKPSSGSQSNP